VEFVVSVPKGTPDSEVERREHDEASAVSRLAEQGHALRIWRRSITADDSTVLGLYWADCRGQLDEILRALPLSDWMNVIVTPLQPHPNDPAASRQGARRDPPLPDPHLAFIYRLEASLGEPVDVGERAQGRRRIVPLIGGTVVGPDIAGELVPGASADWQIIGPDGTALADLRYTVRTGAGDILYVQSRGVRQGSPEVLDRLQRGEFVDAGEYTFRTVSLIETASLELDWLNKGVFVSVGGRRPGGVVYETYLVA
jgi:muconolactone delta-isomerase